MLKVLLAVAVAVAVAGGVGVGMGVGSCADVRHTADRTVIGGSPETLNGKWHSGLQPATTSADNERRQRSVHRRRKRWFLPRARIRPTFEAASQFLACLMESQSQPLGQHDRRVELSGRHATPPVRVLKARPAGGRIRQTSSSRAEKPQAQRWVGTCRLLIWAMKIPLVMTPTSKTWL